MIQFNMRIEIALGLKRFMAVILDAIQVKCPVLSGFSHTFTLVVQPFAG
jgi:hypothetical protein